MDYYSYEHRISGEVTLSTARLQKATLEAIEGLTVVDKRDGVLWLLAHEPRSLSEAPRGSHDFARGWLLFATMLETRYALNNANVWWDICETLHEDGPRLRRTGEQVCVTHRGYETRTTTVEEDV